MVDIIITKASSEYIIVIKMMDSSSHTNGNIPLPVYLMPEPIPLIQ